MGFLLDTHTLLWFIENDPRLSPSAKSHIENTDESLFLSVVSLWKIAIKVNIGKLQISSPLNVLLQYLEQLGIEILPIDSSHLISYTSLPLHHRDPFDRMIIIQAIHNKLKVIGADESFDSYSAERIW